MTEQPLAGKRVAVTRPARQARPLADRLRTAGAEVVVAPLIVIADPESLEPLDAALDRLANGRYGWVVFASVNSALKVLERLHERGSTDEMRADVAAVGPATAEVLRSRNVPVKVIPRRFTGEDAAAALGSGTGSVLLPRVEGGPPEIPAALTALGWRVDEVTAYRNLPAGAAGPGVDRIVAGAFDVMTLTSASAARNLAALVPPPSIGIDPAGDRRKIVACIGPSTAAGARAAALRVDVVAVRHTASGLVEAIIDYVGGMAR